MLTPACAASRPLAPGTYSVSPLFTNASTRCGLNTGEHGWLKGWFHAVWCACVRAWHSAANPELLSPFSAHNCQHATLCAGYMSCKPCGCVALATALAARICTCWRMDGVMTASTRRPLTNTIWYVCRRSNLLDIWPVMDGTGRQRWRVSAAPNSRANAVYIQV